jgi:hypothetical protein
MFSERGWFWTNGEMNWTGMGYSTGLSLFFPALTFWGRLGRAEATCAAGLRESFGCGLRISQRKHSVRERIPLADVWE